MADDLDFRLTTEQRWLLDLDYEVRTLAELLTALEKYHQGPTLERNACLEAALLHARLLIEFLAGRPPRKGETKRHRFPDDVDPECFLPGWALTSPSRFDEELVIIDRHLAHLSKDRGTAGTMGPGFVTELADRILSALAEFEAALSASGSQHFVTLHSIADRGRRLRAQGPTTYPPE